MKKEIRIKQGLALLMTLMLTIAMAVMSGAPVFADEEEKPSFELADDYTGKTVILHSNDVHGNIAGYANIAGLRDELEKRGADVIMADSGDYMQGSPYVNFYKGKSAVRMMNKAGYDIATIGNHEFDYTAKNMLDVLKDARFKVICADVYAKSDGKDVFDDTAIIESGGVKVGFFGMDTPETMTKSSPKSMQGYGFNDEETEVTFYQKAQQCIDELKADGADIVICLTHLGVEPESEPYRSYDLYNNTEGIDLILDGHSHTVMEEGENGEPIMQTGTKFEYIGVAVIDEKTKQLETRGLYPVTEDSYVNEDVLREAHAIMAEVDGAYAYKMGESKVELNGAFDAEDAVAPFTNGNRDGETNLGDFATDALKWYAFENIDELNEDPDSVVTVLNGGGNRDWIHKGDITKKDLNTVWPFANSIVVIDVTGEELLNVLEASTFSTPEPMGGFPQVEGIDFTVDTTREYDAQPVTFPDSTYYGPASIQRVTINSINGKPFDKAAKYKVLTSDFLASGGDTYYGFKSASSKIDTGMLLDDAVSDYLEKKLKGVIGEEYADAAGRIHIITADSQEEGKTGEPEQAETDGSKVQAPEPAVAGTDLAADGKWGPLTTEATQKALSEEADGKLGPDTVRAIQKKVGADEDGIWGPETTRAMQKFLGITEDGKLGPETVKAWQEWCNQAA